MARAKLGEILMRRGVIDAPALKRALGQQTLLVSQGFKLGQLLVEMKLCDWEQVAQALSEQQGVPYADLEQVDEAAAKMVPADFAARSQSIVFQREPGPPEQLCVAFADPADLSAVDSVQQRTGKRLKVFIAAPSRIMAAHARVFGGVAPAPSASVSLEGDLFGDDGGAMAVEHFSPGGLNLPTQLDAGPELAGDPGISVDDGFDSLFGGDLSPAVPTGASRGHTPPAGVVSAADMVPSASGHAGGPDPFAAMGLDIPRAARVARPPTPGIPVHVTVFPDHRPKPAPAPPAPAPAKPTLVLTADSLFGPSESTDPSAEIPEIEISGEVLAGEEVAEEPPATEAHGLFGSSFDASEHADPMHPPATAELDGKSLFGAQFEAEATVSLDGTSPTGTHELPASDFEPPAEAPAPALRESLSASTAAPPGGDPTPLNEDLFDIVDEPHEGAEPLATPVASPAKPAPSIELPKFEPRPVAPRPEPAKAAPPKLDTPKVDAPKVEAPKPDAAKVEAAKMELARLEIAGLTSRPASRPEIAKLEVPKAKVDFPKVDLPVPAPKLELPKIELPKIALPKIELPKLDAPKVDAPKVEAPKVEPAKVARPPSKPGLEAAISPAADLHEALASFAKRPLSVDELNIIEVIEQLADGEIEDTPVKQAKPAHMIAALVRLLIRRGIIEETDFLTELTRK